MSEPLREIDKPADQRRARAARAKSRRKTKTAYLFYAIGLSFFDTISGAFAGLSNYQLALDDFRLGQSLLNVGTYVLMWVSLMVVGVVVLASIIDVMPRWLGTTVRTVYFLPGAVTSAAIVVLWLFILDPQVSPFSFVFSLVGWENRFQVIDSIGLAGVFTLMAFFAFLMMN